MDRIYFEAQGEALLERIGMTKAEFARRMGIRKQNVKALFRAVWNACGLHGRAGFEEDSDCSV